MILLVIPTPHYQCPECNAGYTSHREDDGRMYLTHPEGQGCRYDSKVYEIELPTVRLEVKEVV